MGVYFIIGLVGLYFVVKRNQPKDDGEWRE